MTDESRASKNRLLWVAALLLVAFAVYAPSLRNDYSFDGPLLAKPTLPDGRPNSMTAELRPVADYFRAGYWDAYDGGRDRLYRPVTILSYALTNSFSNSVAAHHWINVLLHAWSVLLAFRLIARFVPSFGAAVFGLHALHSEVVAGIVGRAELLGFCFGAQAVLLFAHSGGRRSPLGILRTVAVPLLLFLAYGSKENAVAWCPFVFIYALAVDLHAHRKPRVAEALWAAALVIPPLIGFLLLRENAIGGRPEPVIHYLANPLAHADTATRIRTAVMLWGYGVFKCLWPFALTSDYGPVTFRAVESTGDPRLIVAGAVLLAWLALGLYSVRRHPLLFLSVATFLGFGFAVSNIPFAIGIVFAERLYFTPTLGIAMLTAWIVDLGFDETQHTSRPRKLLLVPVGAWLTASAVTILLNNNAWNDNTSRVLRDAETNPMSLRTLDKKARLLKDRGDIDGAVRIWNRTLELDPQFLKGLSGLGTLRAEQKDYAAAERYLLQTLDVPRHRDAEPHLTRFNLFVLYQQMQKRDKALEHLRAAWREPIAFTHPHEPLLGATLRSLPASEVEAILAELRRVAPENVAFLRARGQFDLNRGAFAAAVQSLRQAATADPTHHATRFLLAMAVQSAGRKAEARQMLEQLRDDPTLPAALRNRVEENLR